MQDKVWLATTCAAEGKNRHARSKLVPVVPKRIVEALPTTGTKWLGAAITSFGGSWCTRSSPTPFIVFIARIALTWAQEISREKRE
jgi:hypothetical protein